MGFFTYLTDLLWFSQPMIGKTVNVSLKPQKIVCDWLIQDEAGKPLPGVEVVLTVKGQSPVTLKADARGNVHIERPIADKGKTYTIVVKKPSKAGASSVSPVIHEDPIIYPPAAAISDALASWYADLEKTWNGDNHNGKAVPAKILGEIKGYRAHVPKVDMKWVRWSGQYGWQYAPSFQTYCKPKEWPLLDKSASKLTGLDKRVAETLKYYLEVEGSLASVATYDNMTITWGPGIAMGGAFNDLWTEVSSVAAIKAELLKCGFFFKNGKSPGQCYVGYVDEATGKLVFSSYLKAGEKRGPAFDAVRGYDSVEKKQKPAPRPAPAILHVMAMISRADATKQAFADAYARAQVRTYSKGDPAGVSKHWQHFKSLSLMSFVCHLNHWGVAYAKGKGNGVVNEVMSTLTPPAVASADFDIKYAKAHYKYMIDVALPYYKTKGWGDHTESLKTDYKKFLVGLGASVDNITFPDLTKG